MPARAAVAERQHHCYLLSRPSESYLQSTQDTDNAYGRRGGKKRKRTVVQRLAKSYIGYTVNPTRRLRQHNGELVGGAHSTSRNTSHNWRMSVYVYDLGCKTRGLFFEHVWKIRCQRTGHLSSFESRCERLIRMLTVPCSQRKCKHKECHHRMFRTLQSQLMMDYEQTRRPLVVHWPWSLIDNWIIDYRFRTFIVPICLEVDMTR